MRFGTFLATGVEVLQVGQEDYRPADQRMHAPGRFRLFAPAIDEQIGALLADRSFGGAVEGIVVALEVADFSKWPRGAFSDQDSGRAVRMKGRDLWIVTKLDWPTIRSMSLRQQFQAYSDAVLESVARISPASRLPRGFESARLHAELGRALGSIKVSSVTRTAYLRRHPQSR